MHSVNISVHTDVIFLAAFCKHTIKLCLYSPGHCLLAVVLMMFIALPENRKPPENGRVADKQMLSDHGEKYHFFLLTLKSFEKEGITQANCRSRSQERVCPVAAEDCRSPLALCLARWGMAHGKHLPQFITQHTQNV